MEHCPYCQNALWGDDVSPAACCCGECHKFFNKCGTCSRIIRQEETNIVRYDDDPFEFDVLCSACYEGQDVF